MICYNCYSVISEDVECKDKHMVDGKNVCLITLYKGNRPHTVMITKPPEKIVKFREEGN